MAMKETERSLRWFFLISGGLSAVLALRNLSALSTLPRGVPLNLLAPAWYATLSHLVLGALFFVAGLRLKPALLTGARWIQHLVLIAGAALVVEAIWFIAVFGVQTDTPYEQGAMVGSLLGIVVRIAVVAYLHTSLRRLSAEARVRAAGTAFE